MKCGLIIVNFNEYPVTEELLERIKDVPEIDHIVIVDNCSANESYSRLRRYQSDKISIIQSGRNGGYSFGNNCGAKYLIANFHPDIIGIANPDTEFDGTFVAKMKELFSKYPDYAMLSGVQNLNEWGNYFPNFSMDESTPQAFIGSLCDEIFIRPLVNMRNHLFSAKVSEHYRNYPKLQEILNSPDEVHQVWGVGGSLFFIRSKDFEDVGLFDENVFMYYEEHILAFKLQRWLHRKVGITAGAEYLHNHKPRVHKTRLEAMNSGLNTLKIFDVSSTYYFRNYVTSSKFMHGLYALLLKVRWFKTYTAYLFKRLIYRV